MTRVVNVFHVIVCRAALLTDSEGEDDPNARVTVPNKKAKGIAMKSSVRLNEIGPRMSLAVSIPKYTYCTYHHHHKHYYSLLLLPVLYS